MVNVRAPRKGRRIIRKRAAGAVKRPGISQVLKKYVQRAIAVKAENKVVNFTSNLTVCSYLNDNTLRATQLSPNGGAFTIPLGTSSSGRIGNAITTRKLMFNYTLYPLQYDAVTHTSPRPGLVMMMLVRVKEDPFSVPNSTDVSNLFQNGSSVAPPTGSVTDVNKMFNKDYWEILKTWTHKLGCAAYDGTGTRPQNQSYTNNDFQMLVQRKMNITKYLAKTIKFNDTANIAQSKGIFLLTQYCNADGTIAAAGQLCANLEYYCNFEYEDS